MKEKKIFQPLTSRNVCQIYKLLHNSGFVSFPLTQDAQHKVEALVTSINSAYFGTKIYPTAEERAVAYLWFLIKSHPFTDGNKRTACLSFSVVCGINNLQPHYDNFTLDQLAVFIEQLKTVDHQVAIARLAQFLFERK